MLLVCPSWIRSVTSDFLQTVTSHWCDAPDSDESSAWNSGSRWSASISSGPTRRCSDRSEWADRFDRLDRVDLSLDRVDWRSIKFLLIVRRSSLLLDVVVIVIHGCFSACTAVNLTLASTTNNLSMKSRAWADTSFHACDTHYKIQLYKSSKYVSAFLRHKQINSHNQPWSVNPQ